MYKPLIGITAAVSSDQYGKEFLRVYAKNITALEKAGGIPIVIPCNLSSETLRLLYERVDGVLLPGGGDIDPSYYGAELHPTTNSIDPQRDQTEITVARWAVDEKLPIMGICRGHQVFNVALGGTLIQDIASEVTPSLVHESDSSTPRNLLAHSVMVDANSCLAGILHHTQPLVNSIHHQAIGQLAPGLRPTAYSPDGIIEAVEIPEHPFALTVQWHPEDLVDDSDSMLNLFRAFVIAAAKRHEAV
ncbi:MAG: gamma-glutamyl-gamma-aminobutyrate hydrolase family protein [Chloroflexi bacterium]|nr:MAG: gamma-glutamyl-gamma-aminobutyrate hydrolase family protein [Chloroflexota bacterium]